MHDRFIPIPEIELLTGRFPNDVKLVLDLVGGQIESGTLMFRTPTFDHAVYVAASQCENEVWALNAVLEH